MIEADGLLANAIERGAQFRSGLAQVHGVREIRGAGLLLGIVLAEPVARDVEAAARMAGVLVNAPAADVIRLAPPLNLTADEVAHGIAVLAAAIASVRAAQAAEDPDGATGQAPR